MHHEQTREISTSLKKLSSPWSIFQKSVRLRDNGTDIPLMTALASEKISQMINDITDMDERLPASAGQ